MNNNSAPSPDALLRKVHEHVQYENYKAVAKLVRIIDQEAKERPILKPAALLIEKALFEIIRTKSAI